MVPTPTQQHCPTAADSGKSGQCAVSVLGAAQPRPDGGSSGSSTQRPGTSRAPTAPRHVTPGAERRPGADRPDHRPRCWTADHGPPGEAGTCDRERPGYLEPRRARPMKPASSTSPLCLPGATTCAVQKSGYVSLSYGQRRPLQPGTPIQIGDGQHFKDIEFRMPRGSVDLRSIVRRARRSDARHHRASDAVPVCAGRPPARASRRRPDRRSRQLPNLGAESRRILRERGRSNFSPRGALPEFAGRGGAAARSRRDADRTNREVGYAPTYFPGVPSVFEATPVNVGLGAEVNDINFNVLLVHTARISGRVNNLDGTPVTAGNVNLTAEGATGGEGAAQGSISAAGSVGTERSPSPTSLRDATRLRADVERTPWFASNMPSPSCRRRSTDVVSWLSAGAALTGTVTFRGAASSLAAGPRHEFRVVAQPSDSETLFRQPVNARVDKDGQFHA